MYSLGQGSFATLGSHRRLFLGNPGPYRSWPGALTLTPQRLLHLMVGESCQSVPWPWGIGSSPAFTSNLNHRPAPDTRRLVCFSDVSIGNKAFTSRSYKAFSPLCRADRVRHHKHTSTEDLSKLTPGRHWRVSLVDILKYIQTQPSKIEATVHESWLTRGNQFKQKLNL